MEASGLIDRLEAHRDVHFRRLKSRRVTGDQSALKFIDESGFCTAFTAGLGVACLREAIAGEREPVMPEHIQHDYAIGRTWELKNRLPAGRQAYYGKVIAGRPGFIALAMLPAFLRLRVPPGGYKALYAKGALSRCAKLVMDTLSRRGPAETRVLKLSSGFSRPRDRAEFDRAMKELQEKFLAVKVEERRDPFTYIWGTLDQRWAQALHEARALSSAAAVYQLVRRYFEVAAFGTERSAARILAIDPALVERAARRLERERMIVRGVKIDGLIGAHCLLVKLMG
ncbi:MAG: hypothetical protein IVW54_04705 [Candidatus Binataceae bacterium]|nr:hypothetical protein [Candidatus Binataceae bacterium]